MALLSRQTGEYGNNKMLRYCHCVRASPATRPFTPRLRLEPADCTVGYHQDIVNLPYC
jgi:hypothetical protein